jgi:hypothetical protein
MKSNDFMVLGSILILTLFSVRNVSADSGAAPKSAPIFKQTPKGPQEDPANRLLKNMTKELGLSNEQQAEIKSILLNQQAKRQEIIANAAHNFAERSAKFHELRDATDSLIRPILTADQLTTYNAMLARRKLPPAK